MPTPQSPTHTPTDTAMENIAVLDCLTREGFGENTIDRVERAVNAYEPMLEALKKLVTEFESMNDDLKKIGKGRRDWDDGSHPDSAANMAYQAIAQAEGGSK